MLKWAGIALSFRGHQVLGITADMSYWGMWSNYLESRDFLTSHLDSLLTTIISDLPEWLWVLDVLMSAPPTANSFRRYPMTLDLVLASRISTQTLFTVIIHDFIIAWNGGP